MGQLGVIQIEQPDNSIDMRVPWVTWEFNIQIEQPCPQAQGARHEAEAKLQVHLIFSFDDKYTDAINYYHRKREYHTCRDHIYIKFNHQNAVKSST